MTVKIEVSQIFSTAVLMFQLDRAFTAKEMEYINGLARRKNTGNSSSVNGYVFRDTPMKDLHEFAQQCANKYFQEIYIPDPSLRIKITQSWANYTMQEEHHHRHNHPNSFISGVLYTNADEKTDSITFYNPKSPIPMGLGIRQRQFNTFNSHEFKLPVHTGHLLLFPSYVEHSVDTVKTDTVRTSIAFNTCPIGVLGDDVERTRLEIRDAA